MIPDVTILAPYIASARHRVGARRTDLADITRILAEFGAYSTAASLAIQAALTDHYACVVEPDRLTPGAIVTLARHHVPDDMRRYIYNPSYIAHEECLGEYRVIVDAIARQSPTAPAIPMPIDRYGALRCATDQWFRDRSAAIDALCLAEAERLLAEREVAA
ncbi:MAG: hypothetical protein NAOJABEB_03329 [Steroidobacteraceae bacterium]|nr:hypothetical protein [Steroidobacteraceae bacterium]